MNLAKHFASTATLSFIAAAALLGACTGGGDTTGAAGTNATGAAGTTAAGAAGTTAAGTAGTTAAGTAGTTAAGTAGTTAAGTAGTTAAGTAGTTAAGTAGTGAAGMGAAGTGAAGTGAAGTGAAGTGAGTLPKRTAGCDMPPPAADSSTNFVKHDIAVTGVDQGYITAHPLPASDAPYTFTNRNYYVRLPTNYDPATAYGVAFGGTGCAGGATVGSEGGYLPKGAQMAYIQVGLSYVPTSGGTTATNPGACFADGSAVSPEVPYFDAILKEIEAKYCVNAANVVVSGYSSGAWEAFLLGWARAGVVRGIATEAGGLRMNRPPGTNKPVAAFIVTTLGDTENPANLTPTDPKAIALGALGVNQARDEILARNGCTGTATTLWDPDPRFPLCQKYTGCPAAYPVVYCVPNTGAHYPAHPPYTPDGMYKFLSSLPAVP